MSSAGGSLSVAAFAVSRRLFSPHHTFYIDSQALSAVILAITGSEMEDQLKLEILKALAQFDLA